MSTVANRLRNRALARIALKRPNKTDVVDADLDNAAAELIDALVAALERAANEGQNGQLSLHTLMACGDAMALARRKG